MQFKVSGISYRNLVSWGRFLTEEHSFGNDYIVIHQKKKDRSEKRKHYQLTIIGCSKAAVIWMKERVEPLKPAIVGHIDRWSRSTFNRPISIYSVVTNPSFPDYKTGCYGKAMQVYELLQTDPRTTTLRLKQDGITIHVYRQKPRRVSASAILEK